MNSSYSKKRHIQQSNLLVESRFLQKKNDNNLILEASTPFKNKEEGNDFRNWVNDNYPDWAKENQLDRSGQFNNSYIQKAYQEFGDEYTPSEKSDNSNSYLQPLQQKFSGKFNPNVKNSKTKSTDFNLAKKLMNNFHKPVNDEKKLQVASSTSRPYVLVDFYPDGTLVIQKDKNIYSSVYDKSKGTWYTVSGNLVMNHKNKKYIITPSDNNQFWNMLKDGKYLSWNDSSFVQDSNSQNTGGFVIPFAFPEYETKLDGEGVWLNFQGYISKLLVGGSKQGTYGKLGHGGVATVTPDGNTKIFEFGRYTKAKKGYGIVISKNLGKIAKIKNGQITNVEELATKIKSKTEGQGPLLSMDYAVINAPDINKGIEYAQSVKEKEYSATDFSISNNSANCGTYALEVVKNSGIDLVSGCFPTPKSMISRMRRLTDVGGTV